MKHLNFVKAHLALLLMAGVGSCGGENGVEPSKGGTATPVAGKDWKSPSSGLEFVWIKPGVFEMGSPESEKDREENEAQHRVTLTKGFWLGRTEVTQGQWEAVMRRNPSHFKGANLPVETVSWDECQEFITKLCEKEGVPKGTYRLPTEAEWEYACRAGTTGAYAGELGDMAWYGDNSGGQTHPGGQKKANAWGLYDMHGNVWEWCQDWYGDYPKGSVTDPSGPGSGSIRVFRGGSWNYDARDCRSAARYRLWPGCRDDFLGFRLLRTD